MPVTKSSKNYCPIVGRNNNNSISSERKYYTVSRRRLRYILGIGQEKGFNTLVDYKPGKDRFIPLLNTGMPDKNGVILWEGDYVEFKFDDTNKYNMEGEIVYEPENACFSVKFTSLGESVLMPLLGLTPTIWSTGKNAYEHRQ